MDLSPLSIRLVNEFLFSLDSKTMIHIHPFLMATLSKLYPALGEKYVNILLYASISLFDSFQERPFRDISERWIALFINHVSQAQLPFSSLRKSYFQDSQHREERRRWNALFLSEHVQ
jgi:hypothetical protein